MSTGMLLVDKPGGITSHDVVAIARRALGERKVGHAGTLDPMATGLLLLGVGSATRLLTYLVGLDKTYRATVRLGAATTTDDAEGEIVSTADASRITPAVLENALATQRGDLDQAPSAVSAIKVDGRRAYDRVRAGEDVQLPPRRVTVHRLDLLGSRVEGGHLDLDIDLDCSSGTYVRAIARDLGAALGVGGHLTALRRTRVGPFAVADAVPAGSRAEPGFGAGDLRPAGEIAGALFPTRELDDDQVRALAQGKRLELDGPDLPVLAALRRDGALAGLVEVRAGRARVLLNLPTSEVLA
ncbi:MAG: tRNA pseudouridine(55) synthase TruB [Actinomycetales bacterium]|nr:tRNA pseudouridine(55) synthase TruB [Actinomycetales bacterium]